MRIDGRIAVALAVAVICFGLWFFLAPSDGLWAPWWLEFIFASSAIGILLWGVRGAVAAGSVDQDLGPGRRHEAVVHAQVDRAFEATDEAVQAALGGDMAPLQKRLHGTPVEARMRSVLGATFRPVLLLNPAWHYVAWLAAVAVFFGAFWSQVHALDAIPGHVAVGLTFLATGLVAWFRVRNRFGGPPWKRVAFGLVCVALVVTGDLILGEGRMYLASALPWGIFWWVIGLMVAFSGFGLLPARPAYVATPDAAARIRNKDLRRTIGILAAGFLATLVMGAIASVPFLPDFMAAILRFGAAVLPGFTLAWALPSLVRTLGVFVEGRAAERRVQRRRQAVADRILQEVGA